MCKWSIDHSGTTNHMEMLLNALDWSRNEMLMTMIIAFFEVMCVMNWINKMDRWVNMSTTMSSRCIVVWRTRLNAHSIYSLLHLSGERAVFHMLEVNTHKHIQLMLDDTLTTRPLLSSRFNSLFLSFLVFLWLWQSTFIIVVVNIF